LALEEGKGSMSSTQISELIANIKSNLQGLCNFERLEHGRKREGYVDSKEIKKGILDYSQGKKIIKRMDVFFRSY
jgi:hypothetical protein